MAQPLKANYSFRTNTIYECQHARKDLYLEFRNQKRGVLYVDAKEAGVEVLLG